MMLSRYLLTCSLYGVLMFAPNLQANDQVKYADFISALENLSDQKLRGIIVKEVYEYLHRFPKAANLHEMHFKIATIFHDEQDNLKSFYTNMEVIYLYPGTNVVTLSQDRVRSLLVQDKKFRDIAEKVDAILHPATSDSTKEVAYFLFLRDMYDLGFKPVNELLIKGCEQFLNNFTKSVKADVVLFWQAELLASERKYYEALSDYLKLTYLYDKSLYVTSSKLKIAELFTEKLNNHDKAILTYEEFLVEYPDDPQAAQAQFKIAQITEKERKKYLEAINAYTGVAKRYPKSLEAVPAMFEAARLYEDRFKEYDQAIRIYTEVVRDFPNDLKAPYAFAEAARIYEKKLKDYFNAANVYFKVYGHYPESSIAAQSLFAAAEINEKQLKDNEKAITYYRFVIDKYPDNKLAGEASKRIDKLSKAMVEPEQPE